MESKSHVKRTAEAGSDMTQQQTETASDKRRREHKRDEQEQEQEQDERIRQALLASSRSMR